MEAQDEMQMVSGGVRAGEVLAGVSLPEVPTIRRQAGAIGQRWNGLRHDCAHALGWASAWSSM
jgi:hypothetical protein